MEFNENFSNLQSVRSMENEVLTMQQNSRANGSTNNGFNGRIFFQPNETYQSFDLYSSQNTPQVIDDAMSNATLTSSELSKAYFSVNNREVIQNSIIQNVKQASNNQYNISRQNDDELQIIMNSYYLQYSKNLSTNIQKQVDDLNELVINECVRIIIPNIQQYLGYRRDISAPIPVLPRSQNVSNRGRNTFSLLIV